jgi:hypothetical protein
MIRNGKKWSLALATLCTAGAVAQDPVLVPEPLSEPQPEQAAPAAVSSAMAVTLSQLLQQVLGYTGNRTEGLYFQKKEKNAKPFLVEVASADEGKTFSLRARVRFQQTTPFAPPPPFPQGPWGPQWQAGGAQTWVQDLLLQVNWDGVNVTQGPTYNEGQTVGRNYQRTYNHQWNGGYSYSHSSSYSYRSDSPMTVVAVPGTAAKTTGYVLLFPSRPALDKYAASEAASKWDAVESGTVHAVGLSDIHYLWLQPAAVPAQPE